MRSQNQHGKVRRVALLIETSRIYGRGILRVIAHYARVHGSWSFVTVERELHSGVPEFLGSWRGQGIIARIEDQRMADKLRKLRCPVVDVLGQRAFEGIPSFDTDSNVVAQVAADFFLRSGFEQFAYSGYKGVPFSDRRGDAFASYLERKGKRVLFVPSETGAGKAGHIQAVEERGIAAEKRIAEWLSVQQRPLAVLACNDVRAQQVLNACREYGIRVPEEIAIMGVDNDDVLCELCDPPLTSIEPDTERLGYEAAALLDRLMAGERPRTGVTLLPPRRIVERTSTDMVAIDDPIMVQAIRFIRQEVGTGIAVKDVLANVGRSRTDLEQRFRRWLRTSIHAEILRRRLERVSTLLKQTDLTLSQIGNQTGFSTAAHLCRLFQKHFGVTPTTFRAGRKNRQ